MLAAAARPPARERLGLRPYGVDVDVDAGSDDGELLHVATRGDDRVFRGAAGLVRALAAVAARRPGAPLSVWCAGAGGAAEPLTVLLLGRAGGLDVDVIATDVGSGAVDDARALALAAARLAHVPRSFVGTGVRGGRHVVDVDLAGALRVASGDLRHDAPCGPFDLIVCRDVLHHYQQSVAVAMLTRLVDVLADDGVLALGAVDALALGVPLNDDGVGIVLVDRGLRAVPVPAVRDERWCYAALLDGEVRDERRLEQLSALAIDGSAVAIAALHAAAGRVDDARAAAPDDVDGALVVAYCDWAQGRINAALSRAQAAARAEPRSWVAHHIVAECSARVGQRAEARAARLHALRLLDADGVAAGEVTTFLPELDPRHVGHAARRALALWANWHGL
jgi:hypothetical protein